MAAAPASTGRTSRGNAVSRVARPRVVFFDCHGTLVDTFDAMYRAVDDVLPMASTVPALYLGIQPAGTVTAEWDVAACRLEVQRVTE